MKKFRARFNEIKEFEVVKETEKQIVYINEYKRECREAKIADWQSWHNSKEDAINYLIRKKQAEINQLEARIIYIKEEMNKIYKL
jgi:hypothetical protein